MAPRSEPKRRKGDHGTPLFAELGSPLERLRQLLHEGQAVAGVDEAGRGPWAGPVVAAAVVLNPAYPLIGLTDSKKLSARARERLYEEIVSRHHVGIAIKSAAEIDQLNIRMATLAAMREAVGALSVAPLGAIIDGKDVPPGLACTAAALVKGDLLVPSISAASIVAKVTRDRMMMAEAEAYPHYGFAVHMGYGTREHAQALNLHGPCPLHRVTFKPVALIAQGGQIEWGGNAVKLKRKRG